MKSFLTALFVFLVFASSGRAEVYSAGERVIGTARTYTVTGSESLIEIARKFDLGYNAITAANPNVDPFAPGDRAEVEIPVSWIVPETAPQDGILINLSEMRLYLFFTAEGSHLIATFPIGIGREGDATPLGAFKISAKIVNPSWYVPKSVKEEKPWLPDVVPPGPDNPLGTHALRLSNSSILIHGTNRPWGIGRKVSHGCLRLYPEDITQLFELVSAGNRVVIVREPVKVGAREGRVYIEVHKDAAVNTDYAKIASEMLLRDDLIDKVSTGKFLRAIAEKRGVPVDITY